MSEIRCPNCGEHIKLFGGSHSAALTAELKAPFWGSLSLDPRLAELGDEGRIEEYDDSMVFSVLNKGLDALL